MKCKLPLIAFTVSCWFVLNLIFSSALLAVEGPSIQWHKYNAGMQQSRQTNKKIFLHFWAEWCAYCTMMERDTFHNKAVVEFLNEHFISIKVDFDREKNIANHFQVRGLPNTFFLTERGERISNLPGYIAADAMLGLLKYVQTESYKKMSFGKFLKGG